MLLVYRNQVESKSTTNIDKAKQIPHDTYVLVHHEQPRGKCGKRFRNWKRIFFTVSIIG